MVVVDFYGFIFLNILRKFAQKFRRRYWIFVYYVRFPRPRIIGGEQEMRRGEEL